MVAQKCRRRSHDFLPKLTFLLEQHKILLDLAACLLTGYPINIFAQGFLYVVHLDYPDLEGDFKQILSISRVR